jgi:hypothetical protein
MSKVVPVVAVGVLLLAGALAVGYAGGEAGERYGVDNESWTADPGNETNLSQSYVANASYDSSVTVRDSNCGQGVTSNDTNCEQLRPGEDYRWNNENGTVKALENGSINESEESTITYGYGVPNDQQQALIAVFATGYEFLAPLVVILMVGVALGSLLRFVS